ncbi:acetolactate synthase [Trichoderma arundinaceum]|uniref:Acetolactate synthase n=1 Tax=Trichoderma arundinaceum TaxID=490622 RepID=A0A395ND38_TRIAR|nr:acetolactate synthase [Trichoderma arundinaceum]
MLPKDVTAGISRRAIPTETALPSLPSAASRAAMELSSKQLAASVKRAADLINIAKKPIIYAGQGVIQSEGGTELLKELAEKASIPVTTTLHGLGAFDELEEKSLHMLGMHGSAYANMAMQQADATEAVEGDVGANMKLLIPQIAAKTMDERKEWFDLINGWKQKWPLSHCQRAERTGLIKPQTVIEELSNLTADRKDQMYIATGVGQHLRWRHPRSMITSGGLGTMGYGLLSPLTLTAMPPST